MLRIIPGALATPRYLLAQPLGDGPAGTSRHVAVDLERGGPVTLEVAPVADELHLARASRASRAGLALAGCPEVIRWRDQGRLADGRPFLVHELDPTGPTLDLRAGTLDERLARLEAAATCVAALHARGVTHRDLAPERFLVIDGGQLGGGQVRLADVGAACVAGEADVAGPLPADRARPYLALEQWKDARSADPRADVYALGAMLHLALTGRLPHDGEDGLVLSQLLCSAHAPRGVRPSDLQEGIPPALDHLCARSLRPLPAGRPASAAAFLEELRRARAGLAGAAPALRPRRGPGKLQDELDRTLGVDRSAPLLRREPLASASPAGGSEGRAPAGRAKSRPPGAPSPLESKTVGRPPGAPPPPTPKLKPALPNGLLGDLVGRPLALTDRDGARSEWTVVEPLGRGATGEAWLLRREQAEAALKVSLDRNDLGFEIERRILEQLQHPNVIGYLGRGPRGSLAVERAFPNPLTLLEAVSRGARRTRYPPLPPGVVLELGHDLLRGIAYLHSLSFAHHDVKLANFLIVPVAPLSGPIDPARLLEGVARSRFRGVLIDLGGARSFSWLEDLNEGRDTGDLVLPQLTPLLAPPEVLIPRSTARGMQSLLLPSHDVYAAALTIYMMLTGEAPYDHLGAPLQPFSALLDLKSQELAEGITPLCRRALEQLPVDDVRFVSTDPAAPARFFDALWKLLRAMSGPPEGRPSAAQALRDFSELANMRGGELDPRPRQGVFAMDFSANRLVPSPVACAKR